MVARRLGEHVGEMCLIRPISADGEWLEAAGAAYHRDPELLAAARQVLSSLRQRVGQGVSGAVAATGQPLLISRVDSSELLASTEAGYRPLIERLRVASLITLPLLCRGKVVAVANLTRSDANHPYSEDDLGFAQSVADHAALALGNALSYAAERAARDAAEAATIALREAEARFAGCPSPGSSASWWPI